jgi:hypothetical protein
MAQTLDLRWFDEIYDSGDRPSLEQRAKLSGHVQLRLPERAKRDLIEYTQQCLHQLGQGYSRGLHTLTYNLVIGTLPMAGIDQIELEGYISQFRKTLAKHSKEVSSPHALAANFR